MQCRRWRAFQPIFALRASPETLRPRRRMAAPREGGCGSPSSPFGLCRTRFAFGFARLRHAKPKAKRGAKRGRTADLLHAMQALYQLSYGPRLCSRLGTARAATLITNQG